MDSGPPTILTSNSNCQEEQVLGSVESTWLHDNFVGPQCDSFETFYTKLKSVLGVGLKFKTNAKVNQQPQSIPVTKSFSKAPSDGISFDALLECYGAISSESTNWASPNFMGFPDAGNSLPALSAAIMIPLLNQNLANQDICSPSATFVEMELVHWLRALLGFPVQHEYTNSHEAGGTITLGGCLSNTVALLAARERCFPGSRMHGLPVPAHEVCVLVPQIIEHYSIRSAMAWLGLGENHVVRVPVDSSFRIKIDALRDCIESEKSRGRHIIACCAYAGDSRTMCVDNLAEIATCLKKYDIWFHVDACHGFQLAFSEVHRHKLNGIALADSVTIDPHKVMWTPTTCSLVLFRDPKDLSSVSTDSDLILKTQWSLGKVTPFIGSKAFDALKLWSVIKYFGVSRIGQLVDARISMAGIIQHAIRDKEDLVLLNDTDINSCIFQFFPQDCQVAPVSVPDLEKLNRINQHIKAHIMAIGDSYLHGFTLKSLDHPLFPKTQPVYVLRTLNGNALTSVDHVRTLLSTVVTSGRKALQDAKYILKPERPQISGLEVVSRLRTGIAKVLGNVDHVALMYGSSVCADKFLFSDIDLMVFVPDEAFNEQIVWDMVSAFRTIMQQTDFLLDDEVPLDRKLIVPLSVGKRAAVAICQLHNSRVSTIPRTLEYLRSDNMLQRLVFNVLTTPTFCVSGNKDLIRHICQTAEKTLCTIAQTLNTKAMTTAGEFANTLIGDGTRFGEDYLGYKQRIEVTKHLDRVWSQQSSFNIK